MTFPRLLAVVLLVSSAAAVTGQQQPVRDAIEVRLLEIDAVVTDENGAPVHGLTASDFELYENGRLQPVTNLTEYRESTAAAPTTASEPAAAPATAPERRTLVLLLDPLPFMSAQRTAFFSSLRSLVERTMRPGDQAQILTWTNAGFLPHMELTSNREQVLAVLDEMATSATAAVPEGITVEQMQGFLQTMEETLSQMQRPRGARGSGGAAGAPSRNASGVRPSMIDSVTRHKAEEQFATMRQKTSSMERIVASMAGADGRKTVIYGSSEFPRIAGTFAFVGARAKAHSQTGNETQYDTRAMLDRVIRAANAHGIAFYALRPEIPESFSGWTDRSIQDEQIIADCVDCGVEANADTLVLQNEIGALSHVAAATGGTYGVGPQGVAAAIERIASDLGSYYSLGWHGRGDGTDRERNVRVRVKNPQYRVRTRTALVDKSDRTRTEDVLVARLFEAGSAGDIEFDVKTGAPQAGRGGTRTIPVELTIPAGELAFVPDGGASAARFTVLTAAGARIGETTKVTRDTHRVTAGEGQDAAGGVVRYSLSILTNTGKNAVSIGVFDESSGLMGVRTIELDGGEASISPVQSTIGDAIWRAAYERAVAERKPLVVFFRPKRCGKCDVFERDVVTHPTIARRMAQLVYATVPRPSGADSALWPHKEEGLAVFDETATMRAKWIGIPDATQFGAILDAIVASAGDFRRAAALDRAEGRGAGAADGAVGLMKLGRMKEAFALLDDAAASAPPERRQSAVVTRAWLDAREGRAEEALKALETIIAEARTPRIAAEAWLVMGVIHNGRGDSEDARAAFLAATELAEPDSSTHAAAAAQLKQLQSSAAATLTPIAIVPFARMVAGRQTVRTTVTSPDIARVVFTLDGREAATVDNPPFSTTLRFADLPEVHTVLAVGLDAAGREIGRHELRVNDAGEVFWLRITEPATGIATGAVPVTVALRAPAARTVKQVRLTWNDAPLATLTAAPWSAVVDIPRDLGVLQAVAELDDGRTTEDAVVLNSPGVVERAEVQLVELLVNATPGGPFSAAEVQVKEGGRRRTVQSVAAGTEAPLTVGIVIDSSASMQRSLPDVQEAALRFLDSALGPDDRAYVATFAAQPRLVLPPTGDRDALRRAVMSLSPQAAGTALNDAMIFGLLQFEGVRGRRALVMFTDGLDQKSRYTPHEVTTMSRRSNVPLYLVTLPLPTVAVTQRAVTLPDGRVLRSQSTTTRLDPRAKELYDIADASGGHLYEVAKLEEVRKIYDTIAGELREQTVITIVTEPGTKENDWRRVEVDIPGRKVRAPAGYHAPR